MFEFLVSLGTVTSVCMFCFEFSNSQSFACKLSSELPNRSCIMDLAWREVAATRLHSVEEFCFHEEQVRLLRHLTKPVALA